MTKPLEFAVDLAERAGKLLHDRFNLMGTHSNLKSDRSVVTEADWAADRMIAEAIRKAFPEDGIVSEELQPISPPNTQPVWVVDPLDGTTNFSLGLPFWGVSIARLIDGWPNLAALYFPTINELYSVQRGMGAYVNGELLQVKPPEKDQPAAFFACCSRTHRRYQVEVRYKPRILGSAAYNLCAIARSVALVGFEASTKIWDLAGGWLLIQEAGGSIEPYEGRSPFPMQPAFDYRTADFPVVTAATSELAARTRSQIHPRQTA